jgi:hypothetical protein
VGSLTSWSASKARQFGRHLVARVEPGERAALDVWATPAQRTLFDTMPRADQRHALDVVAGLRARGIDDPEVLAAGLLHDAGKGRSIRLWHRVAWSLGERFGPRVWSAAGRLPGGAAAMARLRDHDERSAELAARAGCSPRTVALIRGDEPVVDTPAARALHEADEAA